MKGLTEQELLLCAAYAKGATEQELMDLSGKSRATIQRLKRRQDFIDKANEIREGTNSKVTETVILRGTEKISEYLDKVTESSNLLHQISLNFLDKCQRRLEAMDVEDIAPARLPSAVKSMADVTSLALTMTKTLPNIKYSLELADLEAARDLLEKNGYFVASPEDGDIISALNQLINANLLPHSVVPRLLKALEKTDEFKLQQLENAFNP
jgi:hypothetical protein